MAYQKHNATADKRLTVLVVGSTGSIGRQVVELAAQAGHFVRALVRDPRRADLHGPGRKMVVGDVTRPSSLPHAVEDIDAIVFTLGSDGEGKDGAEAVDYGGVRNVLMALGARKVRVALMTTIGVTDRVGQYNRTTQAHDWKRRSERLVRASGLPYTIVRPGWFDYNSPTQHSLHLLQGDRRHAGNSSDGVVARRQIAQVLVESLTSVASERKTFELVAERGPAQPDLEPLFSALEADAAGSLDGVHDLANMPIDREPAGVRMELDALTGRQPTWT